MDAVARAQTRAQRAFYRSQAARRALMLLFARRVRGRGYDLTHLSVFDEADAVGPLQRDEALLLYALTRVVRPRTVVEMGFLFGRSAFNFLQAMPPDAHLHAFDITDEAARVAREHFDGLPRFTFHRASQDEITAAHVGGRPIDLVFLDAAHDLELNQRTFRRLEPLLAPRAIVAVHDTGTWHRDVLQDVHRRHAEEHCDGSWLSQDEYQHQAGERRFVNWVVEEHGGFHALHLHTTAVLRHGLTLLQRSAPLPVEPATSAPPAGARPNGARP